MRTRIWLGVVAACWLVSPAVATAPTAAEMNDARQWATARLENASAGKPPFSFTYDGRPSAKLLGKWKLKRARRQLDSARTEHTLTYTDPQTGLSVRYVLVVYNDFPAVEWTVYFRNAGKSNTPILENIQAMDTRIERRGGDEFVLHGIRGDYCAPECYEPYEHTLGPKASEAFAPAGGRPTNGSFPYYNLSMPGGGLMMALGWPGQWATSFTREGKLGLRITAGQQLTHLYLKPGEEIRTPLVVLLFWKGNDVLRAQNLWRRWMLAHNTPRPGGKLPQPLAVECCENFYDFHDGLPEMRQAVLAYAKAGVKLDYCWRDAGWYPCGGWWQTGTWEPDPKRFPQGFKPFTDWLHARGLKFVTWFEPERVEGGTWLATKHPEWIHGNLLDLGNPEAWHWLVEHIDKLITEQGIDLYRQDFNTDPLDRWRGADAKDRQGITENKHVTGYLAYWDELRRRHPNMLIDSCASGGRRNDLETLRRAVPLLRSDYQGGPDTALGNQGHTHGLSSWIPYYGSGVYATDPYSVRSYYMPCFGVAADPRGKVDWPAVRRGYDECRKVAPYMLGDYYPLLPYNLQKDRWIAWQFDCPEKGEGMIQAFRREDSPYESIRVRLHGLDPNAHYVITDFDAGPKEIAGSELLRGGLTIAIKEQRGSALLTYKKKPHTVSGGQSCLPSPVSDRSLVVLQRSTVPPAQGNALGMRWPPYTDVAAQRANRLPFAAKDEPLARWAGEGRVLPFALPGRPPGLGERRAFSPQLLRLAEQENKTPPRVETL